MKTLTVDDSKRIRLPDAKPRQVFAYTNHADGSITLTRVEPVGGRPAHVKLEKRGKYTVGVLDRPINEEAFKQALEEFP
jgi:hypothetical protein